VKKVFNCNKYSFNLGSKQSSIIPSCFLYSKDDKKLILRSEPFSFFIDKVFDNNLSLAVSSSL
jgi:hypothetical protein